MEWVTVEQPNPVYTLARELFVQRVEMLGLHITTYGETAEAALAGAGVVYRQWQELYTNQEGDAT